MIKLSLSVTMGTKCVSLYGDSKSTAIVMADIPRM